MPKDQKQAEALFDEAQAIMRRLPANMGKAKLEGRLTASQLKALDRLHEIDRLLPNTSAQWLEIMDRRRAQSAMEYASRIDSYRAGQLAKLAAHGLEVGDKVQMHSPGFLLSAGRTYSGVVKVGKRGNVYVHTQQGNFCAFSNPWHKFSEAQE